MISPFDTPPSAATQGEAERRAVQNEGYAPARETGFFNTPSRINSGQGGFVEKPSPARKDSSLLARLIPPSPVGRFLPHRSEEFLALRSEFAPYFPAFAVTAPHRGAAESPASSEEETFSWKRVMRKRESGGQSPIGGDRPAPFARQPFSRRSGPPCRTWGRSARDAPGISIKYGKNSINIDKFTGFFDKKRKRENIVNSCYIMICFIYLSGGDSNMSIIFFAHRICPHLR